ncbi:unnamed protein product [Calypogeia fissa]
MPHLVVHTSRSNIL